MKKITLRGRPRDPALRRRILAAASALLDEGGLTSVTMEAIAERACVGKPTIYREWPNAQAVAMSAFLEETKPAAATRKSASAISALRRQLRELAQAFATSTGRQTAMMIAAAQNDSELAKVFRTHFVIKGREEGRALITRAIAQGELRPDIDLETALDLVYAPFYFRLLIGHAPLTARDTDTILDLALKGLSAATNRMNVHARSRRG